MEPLPAPVALHRSTWNAPSTRVGDDARVVRGIRPFVPRRLQQHYGRRRPRSDLQSRDWRDTSRFQRFSRQYSVASKPVNLLRGNRAVERAEMGKQRAVQPSKFNCFHLVGGGSSVAQAVVDHCCIRRRSYRSPKRPPCPERPADNSHLAIRARIAPSQFTQAASFSVVFAVSRKAASMRRCSPSRSPAT